MESNGNGLFIGLVIALVIIALFAWGSGFGEPKYSSEAEYMEAVERGDELPPEYSRSADEAEEPMPFGQ